MPTPARRSDASRNRTLIVEATRAALEVGEHPPLEEIAARAGVGVATLYRHFPNREKLEYEAYLSILGEQVEVVLDLIDHDDSRGSFVVICSHLVDALHGLHRPGSPPLDLPAILGEVLEDFAAPFAELVREGQEKGDIRADIELVDTLWLLQIVVGGFSVPSATPDVRRRYLSLMFDALAPGEHGALPPLDPPAPGRGEGR